MSSYCTILFDDLEVCSARSQAPDDFVALFQEADRVPQEERSPLDDEEEDGTPHFRYRAPRNTILRRLALLGATREAAEQTFEAWRRAQRERWAEDDDEEEPDSWSRRISRAAETLTLAEWRRRVPDVLATRYRPDAIDRKPTDVVDQQLRDDDFEDGWLWIDRYGSPLGLRALLDATKDATTVTLDLTELVRNGYYDTDRPLEAEARRNVFMTYNPLSPTLVLAEGSSDISVLRASLPVLHPELTDYFSFFNHAELGVDGGANYLVKFLKAFAGAYMTNRMIAVFDNDAAGRLALRQARALPLPPNIIVTCLPDTEIARGYPTIGPQGRRVMDVNGLAAGIEMYLGREALTEEGELRPVRWAGYVQGVDAYQGEVEGKSEVLQTFLARITTTAPADAAVTFPELVRVWEHLIDLVEAAAEASYLRNWARLDREF